MRAIAERSEVHSLGGVMSSVGPLPFTFLPLQMTILVQAMKFKNRS